MQEREQKRWQRGYVDKPFAKGHKCGFKEPQLFTVEIMHYDDIEWEGQEEEVCAINEDQSVACISVQALSGNQTFQTMRVVGLVHKRGIHILINIGITHNFLDLDYTRKLCVK